MSREVSLEQIKEQREKKTAAQHQLREREKAAGLVAPRAPAASNAKCEYETVAEELEAREEAAVGQLQVLRAKLPVLLERFSKIHDDRNPKKLKHKLTVVLVYGILVFVYQMASRREANRTMTRPAFRESLAAIFPDLKNLPHHDTLDRILNRIDVNQLEETHIELVRKLIRQKKFWRYLIDNTYPIAIDGTQKAVRGELFSPEWLERKVGKDEDEKKQYYIYVLEANLAFQNGMVIPLMSEFLAYDNGDTSNNKQDCELKAFYRLAKRLKQQFPRLPVMILLDGLYANGPVIATCRQNNWQFMIVLKDESLPSVWEEFRGLMQLEKNNRFTKKWGNRLQRFEWINKIDYYYGPNQRLHLVVHVVVCEETWQEIDPVTCQPVTKTSRHAWLSSKPLNHRNVHERCNLGARHRWGIESGILVEKRHGYNYEHLFSHDWNAMKGFHYLMRMGHMFNVLAQYSTALIKTVQKLGVRGFIDFVRSTMAGRWLEADRIRARLETPFQLRLD
jgi:hypothetical protein